MSLLLAKQLERVTVRILYNARDETIRTISKYSALYRVVSDSSVFPLEAKGIYRIINLDAAIGVKCRDGYPVDCVFIRRLREEIMEENIDFTLEVKEINKKISGAEIRTLKADAKSLSVM